MNNFHQPATSSVTGPRVLPEALRWAAPSAPDRLEHTTARGLTFLLDHAFQLASGKRLEVQGAEIWAELKGQPVLLVANPVERLDFMSLCHLFNRRFQREAVFLAQAALRDTTLSRLLMKPGHWIPVDGSRLPASAVQAVHRTLANRQVLGLFPPEAGPAGGPTGPGRPTLEGLVSQHPAVACVPCGLRSRPDTWAAGAAPAWPAARRDRLQVQFGQPRAWCDSSAANAAAFVEQLMTEVAVLSQQTQPTFLSCGD